MIKVTELRIGNIIASNIFTSIKPMIVYSVGFEKCSVGAECIDDKSKIGYRDYQLEPIPLTEEILLKFGFERKKVWHNTNVYKNTWSKFSFYLTISQSEKLIYDWLGGSTEITSLHQIQNLYFALTGEELEINI